MNKGNEDTDREGDKDEKKAKGEIIRERKEVRRK